MTITSRYNQGDMVWFLYERKYLQGKILTVTDWNIYNGFTYELEHNSNGMYFTINLYENDLTANKSDISVPEFIDYVNPETNDDIPEEIIEDENPE